MVYSVHVNCVSLIRPLCVLYPSSVCIACTGSVICVDWIRPLLLGVPSSESSQILKIVRVNPIQFFRSLIIVKMHLNKIQNK